jgi:hypothetical protein
MMERMAIGKVVIFTSHLNTNLFAKFVWVSVYSFSSILRGPELDSVFAFKLKKKIFDNLRAMKKN